MSNFGAVGKAVQERDAQALQEAVPSDLRHKVGKVCGRGAGYVRECSLVDRRTAPRDVLLAAVEATDGHPALLDLFETDHWQLTRRPDAEPDGIRDLFLTAVQKTKAGARLVELIAQATAEDSEDGKELSVSEKAGIRAALHELRQYLTLIEHHVRE